MIPRSGLLLFCHIAMGRLVSKMLDRQTRIDLDVLPGNTRVLRQRDEHVRAVLEVRLQNQQINRISNYNIK
jgi:hypothetical protein